MAFTYFFRDMQTIEMIKDYAVPYLRTKKYIDIWDAGCAMGPEPYTLAIILKENMGYMHFRNVRITASDIDESNLFEKIIIDGIYPAEQVERIPVELLNKYFLNDKEKGIYTLIEDIRKAVTFKKHDLLTLEPIGNNFSLIICKNVLLHFDESKRIQVIKMFHDALADEGFFAMEQTQKMPKECEHLFERVVTNAQLFKKKKI